MDVIIRALHMLQDKDENGIMQVALVLKACGQKRKAVKYMLFTEDKTLLFTLQRLHETKDPINLEALDILLTAAEWPTKMQ